MAKRGRRKIKIQTPLEKAVLEAMSSVATLPPPQPGRQEEFLRSEADIAIYGGGAGAGKAGRCPDRTQPDYDPSIETKVLTPKGFKLIGDIKIGDMVCNPDGTVTRVIGVFDRGLQQFYRVTLLDGSTVEASEDHLWGYSASGKRRHAKNDFPFVPDLMRPQDEWNLRYFQRYSVCTTAELKKKVDRANEQKVLGDRPRHILLPLTNPVCMTQAKGRWAKMPPYTLGVLLGDGSLSEENGVSISSADPQIFDLVADELAIAYPYFKLTPLHCQSNCQARRIATKPGKAGKYTGIESAQTLLKRDHLLGKKSWEKFIPDWIKGASVDVRFACLQGLMDTDGTVNKNGKASYCTVSHQLAKDVQYLLRSLGYKATLTQKKTTYTHDGEKRDGRLAYNIYIQGLHLDRLFRLHRKKARTTKYNGGDIPPGHRIISVEKTDIDYARCIQVDHPNQLYLTDDFIVTHNTFALLLDFGQPELVKNSGYASVIFRRTSPQITNPGGLWDASMDIYKKMGSIASIGNLTHTFLSGARVKFAHLQHEKNKYDWQGAELTRCVAKGTKIRMAGGGLKNIEDVQVGDWVETLIGDRPVTYKPPSIRKQVFKIQVGNASVMASADHRFLSQDGNWSSPVTESPGKCGLSFVQLGVVTSDFRRHPPVSCRHPYSGEKIFYDRYVHFLDTYISPAGEQECFDLTVLEASHFITHDGIICRNCGFDELTHFTESQFFYLLSRNRTTSGIPTKVRATTNPDANSWVKELIGWWLDENGEAIAERSGIVRWFIRFEEQTIWGESKEALLAEYEDCEPMSLTFIPATVYDNPKLLEKDPNYIGRLKALHPVDRARLLGGNWKIDFTGGTVFSRDWFHRNGFTERDANITVRFWDLAATAKEQATKNSCYTAGVKMARRGAEFTVLDLFAEQIGAASLEQAIIDIARQDGKGVKVRWELEGGSAGKLFSESLRQKLQKLGIDAEPVKPRGDKLTRAIPFATTAQHGQVAIALGSWNDQFLTCLQKFDGSSIPLITDVTDAASGAFEALGVPLVQGATRTNAVKDNPVRQLKQRHFSPGSKKIF